MNDFLKGMSNPQIINQLQGLKRKDLQNIAKKSQIGLKVKQDFNVNRWNDVSERDLAIKISEVIQKKNIDIEEIIGRKKVQKKQKRQMIKSKGVNLRDFQSILDTRLNSFRQEIFSEVNQLKSQIDEIYTLIEGKSLKQSLSIKSVGRDYRDNLKKFYLDIKREFDNIPPREKVGIRAPIYLLRNSFCHSYSISLNEFNTLILKLRDLGKIELQPGSSGSSMKILSSSEADYYWISLKG